MVGDYAAAGLTQHGYQIIKANSPDDLRRLKQEGFRMELLIVNHTLLKIVQDLFKDATTSPDGGTPTILLAGLPDIQAYLSQVGRGIDDIVVKPFNTDQLALVVERVIFDRRMQVTLEEFKQTAIRLQEENQRLKAVLNQRMPGAVEKALQNTSGGEGRENPRQDVLQSYAEQTRLIQPATPQTDPTLSNKKL